MALHVSNKVRIINEEYNNEKEYIISDISYDIADDNSLIPMYNLYDETTEEILEEPFYESELRVITK